MSKSLTEEAIKSESETIPCSVEIIDAADVTYVRRLIHSLNPGHPVRVAAEILLEQHCLPKQSLPILLVCLKRPRPYQWKAQCAALWTLRRLAGNREESEAIVRCLRNLAERPWHQCYSGICRGLKVVTLTSTVLFYLLFVMHQDQRPGIVIPDDVSWISLFGWSTFIGAYIVAFFSEGEQNLWAKTRADALSALTQMQPLESLPLLVNALQKETSACRLISLEGEETIYATAARALDRVLSQMAEADKEMLPASMILSLAYILQETSNVPLGLTILKILIQFGDTQVEIILKGMPRFSGTRQLRIAAVEALPILQARLHIQETRMTLLRASDAGNISSDTLLRAASESANIDPRQLLRAQSIQSLPPSEES